MIISSFFSLMDDAAPKVRAEAVAVLASAYLGKALGAEAPDEVEAALSMVLDDPALEVRRVLAIAFAEQRDVPRHIILSLAADQPEVSALLIARSPLLADADLIELARGAEGLALVAIALRPQVSGAVCAALVARGAGAIHLALVRNSEAEIRHDDLLHIAQMPGCTSDIREAILARRDVPATVRHALMVQVARSLGGFAQHGGFMPEGRNARMIDDTIRDATISIAARQPAELKAFIAYLRHGAFLTPAIILRSVLGGHLDFLAHALAELSELELARVRGLIRGRSVAALSALFRRAGLPAFLEAALIDAVRAAQAQPTTLPADGLSLAVIQAAESACIQSPQVLAQEEESIRLLALLRRFEAEAARAQSRRIADDLLTRVRKERLELCATHAPMPMLEMQPDLPGFATGPASVEAFEMAEAITAVPEHEEISVPCEQGEATRSASKLKTLIALWRLESEQRHPELADQPLAPANGDAFTDWEIRGAA